MTGTGGEEPGAVSPRGTEGSRGASAPEGDSREGLRLFNLAMQKSRLGVYGLSLVVALLSGRVGFLALSPVHALWLFGFAFATIVLFHELVRRRIDVRLGIDLHPYWMAIDVAFITTTVGLSGGTTSPWYMWYVASAASAAFVADGRTTLVVALASSGAYLGLLAALGQIRGFDESLWTPVGRLVFLYGAAFFCLRGIAEMKEKRRLIRRLRAADRLRYEELTRLARQLDERSRELEGANERILEANRLKSRFLANMSHELRTPLNSIIGFAEILDDRLGSRMDEREQRFLRNILGSGQHLLGLINDLLDLSKIEAGRLELFPEPVEAAALVSGVRELMRGVAEKKGIEIETDVSPDLPVFVTDAARLKQVLVNLISNAVKFSGESSVVTVRARALEAAASPLAVDSVAFEVVDRGIGISEADRKVIFDEFRQADGSTSRAFEGTGLGLALVKRFVEMQGGMVDVESAPGAGSTFRVVFPQKAPAPAGPPAIVDGPFRPAAGTPPPAVLVVEDDPVAYQALSSTLRQEGYETIHARTGEEALDLIGRLHPAIVTLDLVLPGLDGWEVLKQLRAKEATRDLPIVIVTMAANRELGLALGADDLFLKPVERDRLVRRVRELAPPRSSAVPPPRVLLIDDDPQIHEMVAEILEPQGYALLRALRGLDGIDLARRFAPDLVLLDLMMPEMSGFEVADALRSDPATSNIPIVVLTARQVTADEERRLRAQVGAVIQKGAGWRGQLLGAIGERIRRRDGKPPERPNGVL